MYSKSGWIKDLSPYFLVDDGRIIRNKKEMSNVINKFYKEKIESLVSEVPQTANDPLGILKLHMYSRHTLPCVAIGGCWDALRPPLLSHNVTIEVTL